jgi:hypothetical protein
MRFDVSTSVTGAIEDGASNPTLELFDPAQELSDRVGDHSSISSRVRQDFLVIDPFGPRPRADVV